MRTSLALFIVGLMLSFDANEHWTTVSAADGRDPSTSLGPGLPDNIIVDEPLKDVVVEMLRASPTFRHQLRKLGLARQLRVRVALDPERNPVVRPDCRARCVIKRYEFGRIEASVLLLTLVDVQALVAHELEHVREYVEGMNYLAASVQFPNRVWTTMRGHYETARAIDAGDRVASEIVRYRSQQSTATLARRAP